VCNERIPEPYEHQCSYPQEINYFIREEIENFGRKGWDCSSVGILSLERKKDIYKHLCNNRIIWPLENMTVRKPTYSCHNKHNKLVDSLKQNLKKI